MNPFFVVVGTPFLVASLALKAICEHIIIPICKCFYDALKVCLTHLSEAAKTSGNFLLSCSVIKTGLAAMNKIASSIVGSFKSWFSMPSSAVNKTPDDKDQAHWQIQGKMREQLQTGRRTNSDAQNRSNITPDSGPTTSYRNK